MGIFDLLIVYLTFAAPFAVSDYLHRKDPTRAVGVLAFWPLSAWRLVGRWFGSRKKERPAFDDRTKRIFEKLQRELLGAEIKALDLRNAFDRYVGLTIEVRHNETPSVTKSAELLRISGRENTRAASAALARRNAATIRRHHTNARVSFLELIERSQEFNAVMLALELATLLDDGEAMNYLNRAIVHGDTRDEVWDLQNEQKSKRQIAA